MHVGQEVINIQVGQGGVQSIDFDPETKIISFDAIDSSGNFSTIVSCGASFVGNMLPTKEDARYDLAKVSFEHGACAGAEALEAGLRSRMDDILCASLEPMETGEVRDPKWALDQINEFLVGWQLPPVKIKRTGEE